MTLAQLVPLAISLSIGLLVFTVGLSASPADVTSLLRQPGLLIRSLVSMNVVMAVVAVAMALALDLHPAVRIALVALALSPVPPILPNKQTKAGGSQPYVVGLLVVMAALSIVVVPVGVSLIARLVGEGTAAVGAGSIASVVLIGIVVPLALGLAVGHFAPALAGRIARPLSLLGVVLLVAAFLPVLLKIWPQLIDIVGNGTLLALAIFTLTGVAVGHFLGGPDPDDRTVLALATGTRHPGVALAIAAATFPEEKAVIAVVLWHLVVGAIVGIPYVNWRKRVHAEARPGD